MSVLILTGPPASGKNTIAEALAKRLSHCAVVDADNIRRMIVSPGAEPWEDAEGSVGRRLGIQNTSALVRNFEEHGFHTVIVDLLTDELAALYRRELEGIDVRVALLLPSEDEVNARLLSRPDYLSRGKASWLYEQQSQFVGHDEKLDNTLLDPEQAATQLLEGWTPVER